jgi:hypothetical protein
MPGRPCAHGHLSARRKNRLLPVPKLTDKTAGPMQRPPAVRVIKHDFNFWQERLKPMVVSFITLLFIPVLALLYFLPAIAAFVKNHDRKWLILLLTLLLGWTIIGWFILLIWALRSDMDGR